MPADEGSGGHHMEAVPLQQVLELGQGVVIVPVAVDRHGDGGAAPALQMGRRMARADFFVVPLGLKKRESISVSTFPVWRARPVPL